MGANLPEQFDQGQRRRLHRDLEQMRAALQDILDGENIQTGPGVFKRVHNGKVVLSSRGGGGRFSLPDFALPLEMTARRPASYTAASPQEPHVWIRMGVIRSRVPTGIRQPIILPHNSAERWIWFKVNFAMTQNLNVDVTTIEIEQGDELPQQPEPDSETGEPADHMFIPVGVCKTENGNLVYAEPAGAGSVEIFAYFTQLQIVGSSTTEPGGMRTIVNLGYYRV